METKRLLFFILTLLYFGYQLSAQELVREGVQWNIQAVYWSFPPSGETFSVKLEGDTMINNFLYKKMYESYDSLNTSWTQVDTYIREDENKKVYVLHEGAVEIPLYDFNLIVGDTFYIEEELSWDGCDFLEVLEIDTIGIFNGEQRKRWTLQNTAEDHTWVSTVYWIEGLGSDWGLTRYITEQSGCWEHYPYSLLCQYNGENLAYSSNNGASCWVTPITELNAGDGMAIYPNPAKENVTIESKQSDRWVEKVQLYTVTGQLLKVINVSAQQGTIDLNAYQGGAYYLLIEDNFGDLRSARIMKLE